MDEGLYTEQNKLPVPLFHRERGEGPYGLEVYTCRYVLCTRIQDVYVYTNVYKTKEDL